MKRMQLALGINLVINDFVHFMVYLIVDYHFQQDKYLEAFEKHTVVQEMMLVLSRFDIGYNAKIFCGIKPERIRSRNISYTEILDFSTQHTLEIIGNLINSI